MSCLPVRSYLFPDTGKNYDRSGGWRQSIRRASMRLMAMRHMTRAKATRPAKPLEHEGLLARYSG